MLKQIFKRYVISYRTVFLIIAAIVTTGINYYLTYLEKLDLLVQLSSGAEDINVEVMQSLIDSYNGFRYFFSFYYLSDEFYVFILLLFAWIGIFLSADFSRDRESGYGNCIVVRCGYTVYGKNMMRAQTGYIAIIIAIIFLVQLIMAFFVGGVQTLWYKSADVVYGPIKCLCIIGGSYLLTIFYCSCINRFCAACAVFLQNRYFIQALPVLLFAIIPLLIGSTLANVFSFPQGVFDIILPFNYLSSVLRMLNHFYVSDLIALGISIILFLWCSGLLWHYSVKKSEGNYI